MNQRHRSLMIGAFLWFAAVTFLSPILVFFAAVRLSAAFRARLLSCLVSDGGWHDRGNRCCRPARLGDRT